VKGGCIVFVREKGGQTDILGNRKELIFDSEDDAVDKILKVLEDEGLRTEVLESLGSNRLNSPEEFRQEVRRVVGDFGV
ncbi:MAG: glycosyltransferase family 1 protein, partial [Candidatus Nanosalina sp.]